MDRHTCKLCFRRFPNGRALGGHMRSHVTSAAATTKQPQPQSHPPLAATRLLQQPSCSSSPSYSASPGRRDEMAGTRAAASAAYAGGGKGSAAASPGYVLRENPRKSYRMVDPEFSSTFAAPPAGVAGLDYCYYSTTTLSPLFGNGSSGGIGNGITGNINNNNSFYAVVQDGESETESSKAPATLSSRSKRSNRRRRYELRVEAEEEDDEQQHPGSGRRQLKKMRVSEPDQPVSSVSDATPDEDVALCLMMLSRDVWTRKKEETGGGEMLRDVVAEEDDEEPPMFDDDYLVDVIGGAEDEEDEDEMIGSGAGGGLRTPQQQRKGGGRARFQCGTCKKVFRSYQALGGHRASHKKARTCSAASALVAPYPTAPATAVRRPTARIVVDDEEGNNGAGYSRGHRYYQQQGHYKNNNSHRIQQLKIQIDDEEEDDPNWGEAGADDAPAPPNPRIHECPFCLRVFSSGQALGGHKRSHLIGGAAYRIPYAAIRSKTAAAPITDEAAPTTNKPSSAAAAASASIPIYEPTIVGTSKLLESFIDLNLPAPVDESEEDGSYVELSTLSDAEQ